MAKLLRICLVAIVCSVAFVGGLRLRHAAWDATTRLRFFGDIANGYNWGNTAADTGIVKLYDQLDGQYAGKEQPYYALDYCPGRLAIVTWWVKWTRVHFPGVTTWQGNYEFNAPMLRVNMAAELLSAIAIYFLIKHWTSRDHAQAMSKPRMYMRGSGAPSGARPQIIALIGAFLFWLNPAVIWNDQVWPQWDVWLLPFYLFAALLASMEWWFFAGVLIGLGVMFKGQILLVAPMLFLWPLFSRKFKATGRILAGFVIALVICSLPWLLHGSIAWMKIGLAFGSRKFPVMGGPGVDNLPCILATRWNWQYSDVIALPHLPLITISTALKAVYFLGLIVCAFAAARQSRRNDARFLVTLVTPWVLFFALMPQMNCRYLFWGAALAGSLLPGLGFGLTILGLVLTLDNVAMMVHIQYLWAAHDTQAWWFKTLSPLHPDFGWAVMLIGGIYLYVALQVRRVERPAASVSEAPQLSASNLALAA